MAEEKNFRVPSTESSNQQLTPPERTHATGSKVEQPRIPRWRGFNLTEMASVERRRPFLEWDFARLADLGFDFARVPLSYWCWSHPERWKEVDEKALLQVDQAVLLGKQYGIHVCLNLHRIPGYCVNRRELEPFYLFSDVPDEYLRAIEAAQFHWQLLANRYKGIPSDRLSFDLINEPPFMEDATPYVKVVRALVGAIRDVDPDRLIVVDGSDLGQTPVQGIADLGVVQSTRGYLPKAVSHFTANWVPKDEFETFTPPTWPLTDNAGTRWDREQLRRVLIEKWAPVVELGVPVHVGEWGCFKNTQHEVALAWMRDLLSLWKEAGWGWAMWNFRGPFGILDSGRSDVHYEDYHGHKLDREMLELLLAH